MQNDFEIKLLRKVRAKPAAGEWIRRTGEDIVRDSVILTPGTRLTPQATGLAASVGVGELQVYRRFRVAIFFTGAGLIGLGGGVFSVATLTAAMTMRADTGRGLALVLGGLDRVPVVRTAKDALASLEIDHRAGFLLSHVDGASSFETILDVSGMPELDALRILTELLRRGVLDVRR